MKPSTELFMVNENVLCLNCGNKGAIQYYGKYYSKGLPQEIIDKFPHLWSKYKDMPYMSNAVGFGGIVPWKCLNCGSMGLIDGNNIEGYKQAFETIEKINPPKTQMQPTPVLYGKDADAVLKQATTPPTKEQLKKCRQRNKYFKNITKKGL